MLVAMKILAFLEVKPAMHRLSVMNLLDDKLNANLDCVVVAMLLYILCCKSETKKKNKFKITIQAIG